MSTKADIEFHVAAHLSNTLFNCEDQRINARGKVRDMVVRDHDIVMINTDRISAFDRVLGTIPLKGAMLAEQACFWFDRTRHIVPNHVIDRLDAQIMLVKKAEPLLVEVVVRGYLAGSLLREDPHTRGEKYHCNSLSNLRAFDRIDQPIITPTTKAHAGHDQPISPTELVATHVVSQKQWDEIAAVALELFEQASAMARKNGLLLVDTKYEFGLIKGALHLIDEVHTSDSSRFFIEDDYVKKHPHQTPLMLDKEYLRQELLATTKNVDTDEIVLDDTLRLEVAKRYFKLTEAMTGQDFTPPTITAHTRVHDFLERKLGAL